MKKNMTWKRVCFIVCTAAMIFLIMLGIFSPAVFEEKLPYQFYNVLTNSMEPTVNVNDLVCVKSYQENHTLKKGDIITFRAERFGKPIIITHRFSHKEMNEEGIWVYRTHPEESTYLDPYDTKQEDIIGVYIFHIPYLGKLMQFLKSKFGFLWLCEIIVILLIKEMIKARWRETDHFLTNE